MKDWIRVWSSPLEPQANIVVHKLAQAGLHPVLMPKKDSAYPFGFYEVYVPKIYETQALLFIADEIKF